MNETRSDVIAMIRSRGYWDVTVHPTRRLADPIAPADLLPVLQRSVVSLRGWPVPFIDGRRGFLHTPESVGQDIDASMVDHWEAWRFTAHCQFSQLRAVSADWRKGAERTLVPARATHVIEVWEILFYLTELVELAARLALASHAPEFAISAGLHHMSGRELIAGEPARAWFGSYTSSKDDISVSTSVSSDELAARPRPIAVTLSTKMMAWFGFHPADGVLRDYQDELLARS